MRLKISKSKNVTLYYVIKTIYIDGKEKTVTVEKLGNENDVLKKSKGKDPKTWAKNYVDNLNKLENENNFLIEIKLLNENSSKKTIVVDNSSFKFLEKYGFEVISLEDNEELTDKTVSDVISMVRKKQVTYIFSTDINNLNKNVQKVVKKTGVQVLELNDLSNLTESQRASKEDYVSLLNENIDLLKKELYS